jgi:hypothetical protein
MKSVLDVEVSSFSSYHSKEPVNVNLLEWLQSNNHKTDIEKLRAVADKYKRDEIKATLPAITVSGVFHPTRKEENLKNHSRLICIDIDRKGNESIENFGELKEQLFKMKNVAYASLSASGRGYFIITPIAYPKRHKQQFRALQNDLLRYGIIVDTAPQNVASLRGYSWDEQPLIRHDAIPYRKWALPKNNKNKSKAIQSFTPLKNTRSTQERVEEVISNIIANRIDITNSEPDWFRLACSLANEFGELGRDYFHLISQFHPNYDVHESDQKYNHALTGRYSAITIATFFKLAQLV